MKSVSKKKKKTISFKWRGEARRERIPDVLWDGRRRKTSIRIEVENIPNTSGCLTNMNEFKASGLELTTGSFTASEPSPKHPIPSLKIHHIAHFRWANYTIANIWVESRWPDNFPNLLFTFPWVLNFLLKYVRLCRRAMVLHLPVVWEIYGKMN